MSAGTTSALRGACGEDVGENVAPMVAALESLGSTSRRDRRHPAPLVCMPYRQRRWFIQRL